jgi:hypothetical protein
LRFALILFTSISTLFSLQAQDIIYINDGREIKSKVFEITPEFIKYKNYDDLNGPLRNIYIKVVFKIKYESGKQEMFNSKINQEELNVARQESTQTSIKNKNVEQDNFQSSFNSTIAQNRLDQAENSKLISIGYGNGYGGLGINLGFNASLFTELHIGVGWFPLSILDIGAEDMFLALGGAKFFFTDPSTKARTYLDFQFGMIGGEYNEESIYQGGILISTTKKQQTLYGPSVLLGRERFWGKGNIGCRIALGGSYNLAKVEWKKIEFMWAADIGIIFRL